MFRSALPRRCGVGRGRRVSVHSIARHVVAVRLHLIHFLRFGRGGSRLALPGIRLRWLVSGGAKPGRIHCTFLSVIVAEPLRLMSCRQIGDLGGEAVVEVGPDRRARDAHRAPFKGEAIYGTLERAGGALGERWHKPHHPAVGALDGAGQALEAMMQPLDRVVHADETSGVLGEVADFGARSLGGGGDLVQPVRRARELGRADVGGVYPLEGSSRRVRRRADALPRRGDRAQRPRHGVGAPPIEVRMYLAQGLSQRGQNRCERISTRSARAAAAPPCGFRLQRIKRAQRGHELDDERELAAAERPSSALQFLQVVASAFAANPGKAFHGDREAQKRVVKEVRRRGIEHAVAAAVRTGRGNE